MTSTSKTAKGVEFTLTLKETRLFLSVPSAKICATPAGRRTVSGIDCVHAPVAGVAIPVTKEMLGILDAQKSAQTEAQNAKLARLAQEKADKKTTQEARKAEYESTNPNFLAAKAEAVRTNQDAPLGKALASNISGRGEEGVIVTQHYVRPDGSRYSREYATY